MLETSLAVPNIVCENLSATVIIGGAFQFAAPHTVVRSDWEYVASSIFGGTAFESSYVPEAVMGWDANDGHEIPVLAFRSRAPNDPANTPAIYSKVALLGAVPGWQLHSVEIVSEGSDTFTSNDVRPTHRGSR